MLAIFGIGLIELMALGMLGLMCMFFLAVPLLIIYLDCRQAPREHAKKSKPGK
jgi:hypothetical protein